MPSHSLTKSKVGPPVDEKVVHIAQMVPVASGTRLKGDHQNAQPTEAKQIASTGLSCQVTWQIGATAHGSRGHWSESDSARDGSQKAISLP